MDDATLIKKARQCLALEADAIQVTAENLGSDFCNTLKNLDKTFKEGKKVFFTGVGKNAPICHKLIATFNSTGVPTFFIDPTQALHGDLGMCSDGDMIFMLSNSGETDELLKLLPLVKRQGTLAVAITQMGDSKLAANCENKIIYKINREACPLELAPTASTTACLALGDALAMVFLEMRRFGREDFAKLHPGGNLGRILLLRVEDIMRKGKRFASAPDTIKVEEALLKITEARCGTIALYDAKTKALTGVFTDGDLRRCTLNERGFLKRRIHQFMTQKPKTITSGAMAAEALHIFEKHKINDLIVVDEKKHPVGIIDGQDLPRVKAV